MSRAGDDSDFHRGRSAYDRYYGDPTITPNPNLRALDKGPFYAVKMVLSDLGTCGGLQADDRARVLREDGSAIDGLYAIGNTAANAFGTTYPGAGATIAQGLVYGYIAARRRRRSVISRARRRRPSFRSRTRIPVWAKGSSQGRRHRRWGKAASASSSSLIIFSGELTLVGVIPLGPLQRDARVCPGRIGTGPLGVLRGLAVHLVGIRHVFLQHLFQPRRVGQMPQRHPQQRAMLERRRVDRRLVRPTGDRVKPGFSDLVQPAIAGAAACSRRARSPGRAVSSFLSSE